MSGRTNPGSDGNALGSPLMFLPDSSSARATCSTIWLGDHLPGARGVVHAGPLSLAGGNQLLERGPALGQCRVEIAHRGFLSGQVNHSFSSSTAFRQ